MLRFFVVSGIFCTFAANFEKVPSADMSLTLSYHLSLSPAGVFRLVWNALSVRRAALTGGLAGVSVLRAKVGMGGVLLSK